MVLEALRPCPVCGGRRVEHLHQQRFVLPHNHPLADGYNVVVCVECGFVYADISASQAAYDEYYAELSKYDHPSNSTDSGESDLDRERLNGTVDILTAYLPSTDVRILDVGCARGDLLTALKRRGYRRLAGIDPSPVSARITYQRIGEAYQASLMNIPPQIGTFDCVTLSHVLEHVLELGRSVASLLPLLRNGGVVYIEVPDAARYASYVYAPFQDFNTEHINHFSATCLNHAMARQGYTAFASGQRLLRPSAHTETPAIYSLYNWTGDKVPPATDTELKPAILRYIERSADLWKEVEVCVDHATRHSPELIVWGAGQLTLKLLAETSLSHAKLAAIIDSNPIHHGRTLAGAPVLSPGDFQGLSQPILIATLIHQKEILAQIKTLGLTNEVILLPEPSKRRSST